MGLITFLLDLLGPGSSDADNANEAFAQGYAMDAANLIPQGPIPVALAIEEELNESRPGPKGSK